MILLLINKLALVAPSWIGPILMVASGGGAEAEAEGGESHSGPPHLPSLATLVVHWLGEEYSWIEHWVNVIFAFIVAIFLCTVSMRVYSRREMIPGRLQNFIEWLVESMYEFMKTILGDEARKFIPFLGSLFYYILAMNWIGMVPLGHSPSTSINITASLAILVFLYAQYTGITRLGIGGYLHHMAGSPADVISWCMVPLIFPLHIIGELAKPFSLALRLFGNITGEDTLIAVFVALGIAILAFSPVGIPLQTPFYFLGLLLSTIQALVFTLLSAIYILLMLPHEEHAH